MVSRKKQFTWLLIIIVVVGLGGWTAFRLAGSHTSKNDTSSTVSKTDTVAPTVTLEPSIDLSVAQSTSFHVAVTATDNKNVSKVEYRIDGQFSAVSYSSPFSATLDISTLSSGQHTLTITAYDDTGNASKPQQYTFTVVTPNPQSTGDASQSQTPSSAKSSSSFHPTAVTTGGVTIQPGVTVTQPSAPADTTPPSLPGNFIGGQAAEHDIKLTWNAATDNIGVAGYQLWRDGQKIGTVTGTQFDDTTALPGQTYAYTIQSYDAAGNTSPLSAAISITLADITIFNSTDAPPASAAADSGGIEVGLVIKPSVDGFITGVKFYKNTGDTGTHIGHIWTMNGVSLGSVTFTNESATGWQVAKFASPVAVTAGTDYLVSYYAPNGYYTASSSFFTSSFFSSQYLVVPSPAEVFSTSYYDYASSPTFPRSSFQNANYWVDAMFSPSTVVSAPTAFTPCPAYPAFPDASCTGVATGSTLIPYNGVLTVTHDNTILNNLDVAGSIIVAAHNVTIVNSKIHDATPSIQTNSGGDVVVRNTEFYNADNAAILYNNWKAYNLNIHNMLGDGVKLGQNVDLEDSYIHDFSPANGAHSDGGQLQGGESNVVVRHNNIDGLGGNSALFFAPDLGPNGTGPITIDKNLLGGGGFTLAIVDGNNGQYHQSGYTVTNNHFLRNATYGPLHINEPLANFDLWSGNVWNDTGEIIPNPAF